MKTKYTPLRIAKIVIPSIIMMILISLYTIVDGFFISNYVGKTAFAGVNIMMPFLMISGSLGIMVGAGGSALIAKTLGEGDEEKANRMFSMLVELCIFIGLLGTLILELFPEPIARAFGAEGELLEIAVVYTRIFSITQVFFVIQAAFNALYVTAGKSRLGLWMTIAAGVTNMVLDYVLVGLCHGGLIEAALATIIAQCVAGVVPLVYFSFKHESALLRFRPVLPDFRILGKACYNGISEFVSNVSLSVVNMLFNYQLMQYIGEDGVSGYGVIMYVGFIFSSIYFGYSVGISPEISYHYGAKNTDELKVLFRRSLIFYCIAFLFIFGFSEAMAWPLAKIYTGYDDTLFSITLHAFRVYSISFIFLGFNTFASALFTALNNGTISGIISVLRTFILQIVFVFTLPLFLGVDGIWLAVVGSEAVSLCVSAAFVIKYRKKYEYA